MVSLNCRPSLVCFMALSLGTFTAQASPNSALAELSPPKGQKLTQTIKAHGVQVYECREIDEKWVWQLNYPEAILYTAAGQEIGKHSKGPLWEAHDGSAVTGDVIKKADQPNTIAWLLLQAKETKGAGILSKVSYIQRLETFGGVAPETGCTQANKGASSRIPYIATYLFYSKTE